MARGSKTFAATLAALLLAVALVACGGGEGSTSESTATQGKGQGAQFSSGYPKGSTSKKGASGAGSQATKEGEGQSEGGNAAGFTPEQHRDSGGGAAQYEVKGGDNSVQEFGQEADTSEFEAAATALHNFLDARAEGDWDAACRYISQGTIESLEKLIAQAKLPDKSCAAILGQISNPTVRQAMVEEARKADIGSLRTEGDRAYIIYTAGSKTILAMAMTNEDGEWKVASLGGTPLN